MATRTVIGLFAENSHAAKALEDLAAAGLHRDALDLLSAVPVEQGAILLLKDFHRYGDDAGICRRLRNLAAELRQRPHTLVITAPEWRLPAELETALFRITQEALTNAAAHAEAQVVEIRVEICDRTTVDLCISDNGVGFDPSERSSGLGLLGMRERVNMLGGQFAVTSAPGEGTSIRVTAPIL